MQIINDIKNKNHKKIIEELIKTTEHRFYDVNYASSDKEVINSRKMQEEVIDKVVKMLNRIPKRKKELMQYLKSSNYQTVKY